MTYKDEPLNGTKLPNYIKLTDPYPGESSVMKKRQFPSVLRFHKTNYGNNPEKNMLSELILYKPVTEEIYINTVHQLYNDKYENRRKVMEHLEGVEEARYNVEQIQKEIDLASIGTQLDPTVEQDNADCEEEVMAEHPDFLHIDPEQINQERPQTSNIHATI